MHELFFEGCKKKTLPNIDDVTQTDTWTCLFATMGRIGSDKESSECLPNP